MSLKEDNIEIYNNSALILNYKTPCFLKYWIIILVILTILFILLLFIPFNLYRTYNGYVIIKNDKSYINLKLNESDFPINKNNKLYIEKIKYKYKILSIDNDYVLINIKLKDELRINNNIVKVNILKDRTTIFELIKQKIKKGFGL